MHAFLTLLFTWFFASATLEEPRSYFINHPQNASLKNHYDAFSEESPRAIVFFPGMGEPAIKYRDLFSDLNAPATAYYGWDHIGQGFSTHLLPKETKKIHIDSFETHVAAATSFLQKLKEKHSEVFVIAHSMGAHVVLRSLAKHPNLITKLVLTAPLVDVSSQLKNLNSISWLLELFPTTDYPPFYFYFASAPDDKSAVTSSIERPRKFRKIVDQFPEIDRDGPTIGWMLAAQESITALSTTSFLKVQIPVLILQAENDVLVDTASEEKLCRRLPDCKNKMILKSKHEILFEADTYRNQALQNIKDFFKIL